MKKTYDKRTFAMSQLALNLGETAGERNAANDKPAEIDDIVSYVKTRGALSSDELLRVISALTEEHRKAVRAEIRRETEKAFDESGEALRGRMEEVGNAVGMHAFRPVVAIEKIFVVERQFDNGSIIADFFHSAS